MSGGKPKQPPDASERILDAALRQVEDFGVRRFTVDDVAGRVGLSRVTIYRYFPTKDQLIQAVLLRELQRFTADVEAVVDKHDTPDERAIEGFVFGLATLRKHELLNRLLRTEPELILPLLTVNAAPVLATGREFIAGLIRRKVEQDGRTPDEEAIEGQSELISRIVVSFILTPDSVIELKTQAGIRRFAERHVRPMLQPFV